MNFSVADTLVEVRQDVLGRRFGLGVGQPALTEPDEHAGVTPGARRVVAMGEVTGPAREEHDEWHDQLGPDRAHEARLGEELLVTDRFGDHPREARRQNGIGAEFRVPLPRSR